MLQYEWNARTQITMWFDNTETQASLLRDYGNHINRNHFLCLAVHLFDFIEFLFVDQGTSIGVVFCEIIMSPGQPSTSSIC